MHHAFFTLHLSTVVLLLRLFQNLKSLINPLPQILLRSQPKLDLIFTLLVQTLQLLLYQIELLFERKSCSDFNLLLFFSATSHYVKRFFSCLPNSLNDARFLLVDLLLQIVYKLGCFNHVLIASCLFIRHSLPYLSQFGTYLNKIQLLNYISVVLWLFSAERIV